MNCGSRNNQSEIRNPKSEIDMAKRFKWRLEPVKKAKERDEERGQAELAEARRALQTEETKLAQLREKREACVRQLHEKQAGRLNTADLALTHAYLKDLDRQIQAQTGRIEGAKSSAEAKQEALLKTMQEKKVLENLKERDRRKFRKTERRKDQAAMDETANRRASNRGL